MKKMSFRLFAILLAAVVLIASVLAGCGAKESSENKGTAPEATTQAQASTVAQETVDPLGKYTPEIEVKIATPTNATVKYKEGESAENNVWMRAYKDTLGINVKYQWMVDEGQFAQKMNVTIASNDLPDIFPVTGQQFSNLVDADSIEDLTSVYNKYVSPLSTEIINQDPKFFDLGKKGGKQYSIPYSLGGSAYDAPPILYIREDWRKKLNLPEPKTLDDLYKIADAFVNQDPDGNGKKDTLAFGLTKTLHRSDNGTGIQPLNGLEGLGNAYHAYLGTWIKDASGNIVYGSIQPEVKVLLQKLQEMYKNGWLDKEFPVKDFNKSSEGLVSGKIGMEFGAMWNPIFPLQSTVENNKNADWKAYPIPSIDDKLAKPATSVSVTYNWVVKKGFANPEALIKMVNLFTEKSWGKTQDNQYASGDGKTLNSDGTIYTGFKYAFAQVWPAKKNLNNHYDIIEALKSKDPSKLNVEAKTTYDQIQAYLTKGDVKSWGPYKVFAEISSYSVIDKYVKEDLLLYDEYHGIPTATMVEKGSTLDKMEIEAFMKIIMGSASVDEFDKFVTDWKKLGGDAITQELNDAAK